VGRIFGSLIAVPARIARLCCCLPPPVLVRSRREQSELSELVGLFYGSTAELGHFEQVPAESMPPAYRKLLDHDQHMTVAMEAFHGSPVDVKVLQAKP